MSEEEGVDGVLRGVDGDVRGHGLRRQEVPQGAKEDVAKVQFQSFFLGNSIAIFTVFLFIHRLAFATVSLAGFTVISLYR